jgi:hypothetical protein
LTAFPAAPAAVAGAAASIGVAPLTLADALRVASQPGFDRWREQVRRTGGCTDPIHLSGTTVTRDTRTGDVLHSYSTRDEPGGRLRVACGNRRSSRCPSCAWTYAGDTFHLKFHPDSGQRMLTLQERSRTVVWLGSRVG